MLPPPGVEVLEGFLGHQDQAEHVQVEVEMEVCFIDAAEQGTAIEAGIVHQDIERPEGGDGPGDEALDVGLFGDIGLDGHGFPSGSGDRGDHLVGIGLAGGIIDDDRGALGGEGLGDGGTDPLRGAGDKGGFSAEF